MKQPKQPEAEAADRAFEDILRKTISERQRQILRGQELLARALGIDPHKKEDPE